MSQSPKSKATKSTKSKSRIGAWVSRKRFERMQAQLQAWKKKAIARRKEVRKNEKKLARDIERLNRKIRWLEKERQEERAATKAATLNNNSLILLVICLFCKARISFCAITRVLEVLHEQMNMPKAPCTQTVINWVNKLSIVRYKQCLQPPLPTNAQAEVTTAPALDNNNIDGSSEPTAAIAAKGRVIATTKPSAPQVATQGLPGEVGSPEANDLAVNIEAQPSQMGMARVTTVLPDSTKARDLAGSVAEGEDCPAKEPCHQMEANGPANKFIFMIDESIGISDRKLLAITAVSADCYKASHGYPKLEGFTAVSTAVAKSWTGGSIASFVKQVIKEVGRPLAWIQDAAGNLAKASSCLDDEGLGSPVISDISHASANLLKAVYSEHPDIEPFVSACGKISKGLKQTVLACLAPPAFRNKARFMNLRKVVLWAKRMLGLSGRGRARQGSKREKLRESTNQLVEFRRFIDDFLHDSEILLSCQKIIKTEGLSYKSIALCREEVKESHKKIREGMHKWLDDAQEVLKRLKLGDQALVASTDGLESLFGLAKSHGLGRTKDPYRMALRFSAMCGKPTLAEAEAVANMPHAKLTQVMKALPSVQRDRREVFGKRMDVEGISPPIDVGFIPRVGCVVKKEVENVERFLNINTYNNEYLCLPNYSMHEEAGQSEQNTPMPP